MNKNSSLLPKYEHYNHGSIMCVCVCVCVYIYLGGNKNQGIPSCHSYHPPLWL